ncbi:MAG: HlyD family efflux transporter periplasmic adaptor subunit [Planctomyces sp.]|nr:HlyD family efflux transporter periplasmic adaptor subunit [Planctomyces sp.]
MRLTIGRVLIGIFGLAVLAGVVYGFLPRPVDVDLGQVSRGALLVAVNEDGKTRIRDRYVISMPFAGRISRIMLDPGDSVTGGESVITTIFPTIPELLNPRTLAEAEARVRAAESAVERAASTIEKARSDRDWAASTADRIRRLHEQRATTVERLVDAESLLRSRESELAAAESASDIARYELEQARAGLIRSQPREAISAADWQYEVHSPITGKVLRVMQQSAATLAAGAPLIEVGDPADIEMEIDVLSQDAVRIRPGAKVYVDHWGGETPLVGAVRLVEPAGFTKVSALGVEEQRVNVIADFSVPASERATLGDSFRVDARIALWEGESVLQVPASALFRTGGDWSVFVEEGDRAVRRTIRIGHRNAQAAEVLEGLAEGDRVVLHPGDSLSDGSLIVARRRP